MFVGPKWDGHQALSGAQQLAELSTARDAGERPLQGRIPGMPITQAFDLGCMNEPFRLGNQEQFLAKMSIKAGRSLDGPGLGEGDSGTKPSHFTCHFFRTLLKLDTQAKETWFVLLMHSVRRSSRGAR